MRSKHSIIIEKWSAKFLLKLETGKEFLWEFWQKSDHILIVRDSDQMGPAHGHPGWVANTSMNEVIVLPLQLLESMCFTGPGNRLIIMKLSRVPYHKS